MAQTEAHLPATSRRAAARKALLSPVNLIPFPVLAVLALARHYHFVADNPLWLLLGAMILTQMCTTRVAVGVPARHRQRAAAPAAHRADRAHRPVRLLERLGLAARGRLRVRGRDRDPLRRLALRARGRWRCTALTVAVGELTIALGWVKSMVPEPEGHGLALLEVAGTCAVIWILSYNQGEKERVEGSLRQSERRFRALVQHASDIILVVAPDGTVELREPGVRDGARLPHARVGRHAA